MLKQKHDLKVNFLIFFFLLIIYWSISRCANYIFWENKIRSFTPKSLRMLDTTLIFVVKFGINVWMSPPTDPWYILRVFMVLFSESCNLYVQRRLHLCNNSLENRHKGNIRAYWCTSLAPSSLQQKSSSQWNIILKWLQYFSDSILCILSITDLRYSQVA